LKKIRDLEDFVNLLKDLDIKSGDTLWLSVDLLGVGYYRRSRFETQNDIYNAIMYVIGENGTIVMPAYTDSFYFLWPKKSIVFHRDAYSLSGSFSNYLLSRPNSIRSEHPTNSIIAIGSNAEYFTNNHDEHSSSYLPYYKLLSLNAKHLFLGCSDQKNLSPVSFHLFQDMIGLTNQHWLAGRLQSYYLKNNRRYLFTRMDVGGCSASGRSVIKELEDTKLINYSLTGLRRSSVHLVNDSLSLYKNSEYVYKCGDQNCIDCYGPSLFSTSSNITFYVRLFIVIKEIIVRRIQALKRYLLDGFR
jgi:hypothetical protein